MDTDKKTSQNPMVLPLGEIEKNLEYANSSTVGITNDSGPRPTNVRLPLVSPEEEEEERPTKA